MNIVYRGNFGVSFSTESHIKASLEALGHTVNPVQEDRVPWAQTIAACEGADLFLWTSTYSFAKKWRGDELAAVERLNDMLPTAAVHLDLFWGLNRAHWVDECGWFRLAHVFTADGDHEDEFAAAGVNHHWLRPGVYHAECTPGTYREEYASDLAFVGAWGGGYHNEYPGRRNLIKWLKQNYGDRCAFWPEAGKQAIRGQELNDLYASTGIAIGDSCFADTSTTYTSDRAYEAPGRGAFSLYPRIPAVADELLDCVHCVFYEPGNFDDLRVKIEHWLPRAEVRRAVRRAGSAFVRENCSYMQRMTELLEVCS